MIISLGVKLFVFLKDDIIEYLHLLAAGSYCVSDESRIVRGGFSRRNADLAEIIGDAQKSLKEYSIMICYGISDKFKIFPGFRKHDGQGLFLSGWKVFRAHAAIENFA